jgi:phosphoribosylformylglycinamidine synthase
VPDWDAHRALLSLTAALALEGDASGLHDVSDGGLAVALAEMALSSGVGFRVDLGGPDATALFGEGPSRLLVSARSETAATVRRRAEDAGLKVTAIGTAGGDRMVIVGAVEMGLEEAGQAWKGAIPDALALVGDA